eukprot:361196-Chlamydomonas_euryale.AAC.3
MSTQEASRGVLGRLAHGTTVTQRMPLHFPHCAHGIHCNVAARVPNRGLNPNAEGVNREAARGYCMPRGGMREAVCRMLLVGPTLHTAPGSFETDETLNC